MALSNARMEEIRRKASLGIPLTDPGNADAMAYYQQMQSYYSAQSAADSSNQSTGGGVGTTTPVPSYPASSVVPDTTKWATSGYGYTAIVAIGVGVVVLSLLNSFRSIRK